MRSPSNKLSSMGRLSKGLALLLGATAVIVACLGTSGSPADDVPTATATAVIQPPTSTIAPSSTPIPPTPVPPSPTPLSPVISANTVGDLSIIMTFGQGETTRSLAFSPDGTALAAAVGNNFDFAIRLWEIPSGQQLAVLAGHQSIVFQVAFSPDGTMLASASKDETARIWDWRNGSMLQSLPFTDEVVSVAFSPDSQTLAVGGVDGWPDAAIWTYAVSSWQSLMKLPAQWNIPDMAYSPNGQRLVGGGTSRLVHIWRTSDGVELAVLHHAGQVSSVAISPDGSTVATGLCVESDPADADPCTRGAVWLWDLQSGVLIEQLADFPDFVEGVAFSLDGSVLVAGSRNGTLRAYATSNYLPLLETWTAGGILDVTISADSRLLATGRNDGQIDLWRVEP